MIKSQCIVIFLEKIDLVLRTDEADYGLEEKIMKKTLKRLLALALVVCAILSYMVPTANASWWDDLFGGGSSEEEETTTSVTYNFVQTGEGYDAIPDDPAGKTQPVTYTLLGGDYLASCTQTQSIPERYAAGTLNWTYESATEGVCGTTTELEHLPLTSGNRYADGGWRTTMGEGSWIALRIKSPGAGEHTVEMTFRNKGNNPTIAVYILEAEGEASIDHDTVLERRETIHAAIDPDNRVGKVDQNAVTVDVKTDYTAFVGNYTFEADKEYIVVFENYDAAAVSGNYAIFVNLICTPGATEGTELEGEAEVNSILVEKNVVPAADGGYMCAVQQVNGHDYYFRPLEGGKMVIFDLDKHVAGEESLVATVTTGLYYPTHATATDDGRVIIGGDGKKLYIFDTKTMTGKTTPDFRAADGLENEGHNQGSHYGSDGYLYFGTTYGGHLVQYDIDTRTYLDLGDVITASARALAGITANTEEETGKITATYYVDGYLYAKADSANYTIIVKQDVANKKTVAAIDVTDQLGGGGVPHGLTLLGDKYLIAGTSGSKGMVLIDIATFTLVEYDDVVSKGLFSSKTSAAQDVWENGMGGHASEVINGKQYFYINNVGMYSYDVSTGAMAKENSNFRALRSGQKASVTLDMDKDGTEETYILTFSGSGVRLFNVSTKGTSIISDLTIDTSAVGGSSINIGDYHDGVLYIGAWNNWNCQAYDANTESVLSRYVTGGQTDSQVSYVDENGDFHLVSGNYSACVVYEIDPINKTGYGGDSDSNIIKPLISNMKKYDQKRIHTVEYGDGYVFAGTIPGSYMTGGGVGIYNVSTGTEDFIHFKETATASEKCVPEEFSELWDLSVKGIVYSDGRLFGATSRAGGSGSSAVEGTSAQIFVLDYENMAIEATLDLRDYLTLPDGAISYVGGISADPVVEGRMWGIVSDVLFCFEYDKSTKTFNVQTVLDLGHTVYQSSGGVGAHNRKIIFDTATSSLFVSFYYAEMQQVKISDWNAAIGSITYSSHEQLLASSPETYAFVNNNLYYASGTNLYMKPVNVTSDDWAAAQEVDAQIEALGDITASSGDAVAAVKAAYNSLSLRDKALMQETRTLLEVEAQVLELQIEEAIAVVTADSTEQLAQLMLQYDDLEDSQKRYVQNYEDLQVAYETSLEMEYTEGATVVQNAIDALPNPATLADETTVSGVRAAYDALEVDLKALVDPAKLETAEAQIQAEKDEVAAVQTQIDALNVTSAADGEAVAAAKTAYEALTAEQQALVDTANLDAAIEALAAYAEAAEVQAQIDALPDTVTLDNETEVVAARTAYDALSDEVKTAVDTTKLVSAEEQIADIKAAAEVQALIDALPDTIVDTSKKTQISAARTAYDALTDAQKALVDATKLISAETQLAEVRAVNAVQDKIDALPDTVVITDAAAINAARAAYDALAEKLQAKVDITKLLAAEAALEEAMKNAVPETVVYDFELYKNPDFYTDCTKYTYSESAGRIAANFNASKSYGSTYSTIEKWFYGCYPSIINWGVETATGLASYTFRGESDQGMRLTNLTTIGSYTTLRVFVPAAGVYSFDVTAGNTGMAADMYVIPADTVYSESRTAVSTIEAAMIEENLAVSGLNLGADAGAEAVGRYTFDNAGDYILIVKVTANNSKGYSLRNITLNPVIDETTAVAKVGEELFLSLDDAIAYQIENGAQSVMLNKDATVSDLVLESGAVLDLNGKKLTVDSVLTYASSEIIDSSEKDTGVLVIADSNGNMLSADNAQLPIYDAAAGGLRFFEISVKSAAITGKGSADPKYWFQVSCVNFDEIHKLIDAGSELNITVKMSWNGGKSDAVAGADFLNRWADAFANNENIYITVSAVNTEGLEEFSLTPCMAANGVTVKGSEM